MATPETPDNIKNNEESQKLPMGRMKLLRDRSDCQLMGSNCQWAGQVAAGATQSADGRTQTANGRLRLPMEWLRLPMEALKLPMEGSNCQLTGQIAGGSGKPGVLEIRKPRGEGKTYLGASKIRGSQISLYNIAPVCHHLSRTHTVRIYELC